MWNYNPVYIGLEILVVNLQGNSWPREWVPLVRDRILIKPRIDTSDMCFSSVILVTNNDQCCEFERILKLRKLWKCQHCMFITVSWQRCFCIFYTKRTGTSSIRCSFIVCNNLFIFLNLAVMRKWGL